MQTELRRALPNAATGATSLDIFAPPSTLVANGATNHDVSGAALAMRVVMTDPSQVAASSTTEGVGGNSNAIAIADMARTLKVKGKTPSDFYAGLVTNLGSIVSQVQTENTAQNASVTQLQTQRDALSSVNLNDEASALTLLERSYQAASQDLCNYQFDHGIGAEPGSRTKCLVNPNRRLRHCAGDRVEHYLERRSEACGLIRTISQIWLWR